MIRLVNTTITSHNYLFFNVCVVRIFKIYSLSKLQVYNTVLLSTVFTTPTHSPPKAGDGGGDVIQCCSVQPSVTPHPITRQQLPRDQ